MLGYSASGSMIDYYNTADGVNGTGFATELTAGTRGQLARLPGRSSNQVWVDSIRAINYTMFKQAIDRKDFTFPVGGKAAYVFDPEVIRHDDANGAGYAAQAGETSAAAVPGHADEVLRGPQPVRRPAARRGCGSATCSKGKAELSTLRLARARQRRDARGRASADAGSRKLQALGARRRQPHRHRRRGAARSPSSASCPRTAITMAEHYVGFVDFADRAHPLNAGLRGVARQTYDTVPIGYRFGGAEHRAELEGRARPRGRRRAARRRHQRHGQTIYGEMPVGKGRVRFLGALLPDPTEEFYHPYGLQNYAVTYTGYTLLQNMLRR